MASSPGAWWRRCLGAAALFAVMAQGGLAYADATAAERETARSLMAEGRSRREHDDLRGALESFRAADALMHVTTTGLEVARSQIALGQLVEARDTLRQVLRIPVRDAEPKPFADARLAAQSLDEELATRIPGIRIVLHGGGAGEAAAVTVDGVTVPVAARGAPFKVNPGRHVVAAMNGASRAQQAIDVTERSTAPVTLELPSDASATVPSDLPPSPAEEAATPGRAGGPMRVVTIGGFGLGGVGIAVGAVTGVMSLSATSRAKGLCVDNRCPVAASDDLDSAHTLATVSTIAFATGAAGLVLGAIGLLVGDKPSSTGQSRVTRVMRITPWVGPMSLGARGAF